MNEVERIRQVYRERDTRPSHADNPGRQRMLDDRNEALARLMHRYFPPVNLDICRVLDVGCGKGDLLGWFREEWGAPAENLVGIDLRPEVLVRARVEHPGIAFIDGNAEQLPFPSRSFELVCAFTVFSSILDTAMKIKVAHEMARVLSPRGAILWYDIRYANPFNKDTRPIGPNEIMRLFPGFRGRLEANTLMPPIATRLGRFTDNLYPLFDSIPILRSHMIGFFRPKP
jgi:ubiquinone/menaquinone biosynthesis C-methylase UbiE